MENKKVTDLKRKNRHTPTEIRSFIDTVFHTGVVGESQILFWRRKAGGNFGYPFDERKAYELMENERKPYAWYFGTSTVFPQTDGKLRNRMAEFSELHVVVLDDINSKVPIEKLPEAFRSPSYIIESSPGNYQYGLVLNKPINNPDQAAALIQCVYTSGFTDAGGKMPTKLVRLPFGVHGKNGENIGFEVRLHSLTDRKFTPAEIVHVCNPSYTWEQVVEDPTVADIRPRKRTIGASAWHKDCDALTTDGATDLLAQYFIREGMVVSLGPEWWVVQCPWCREHTTGDDTAGYSPLGYGSGKWRDIRGFKCFHDSCKDRDCRTLIDQLVYEEALPHDLPVVDPVWRWKTQWVFDKHAQEVVHIHTGERVRRADLRYSYSDKIMSKGAGKFKADVFLESPDKVTVLGTRYNPTKPSPVYQDEDGLWLNKYRDAGWGDGEFEQKYVDTFIKHVKMLCPIPEEYDYFINWLACKIHDPSFRGAGIIMTTKQFGVGRDTLARMLGQVISDDNLTNIRADELLTGNNNDFLENLLVICNELSDGDRRGDYYKSFERLKELVDPQRKKTRINVKYMRQYDVEVFASFLMFSNHEDVLPVVEGDRRLYVISNPQTVQPSEYYYSVHDEISNTPDWGRHVYRWLRSLTPDFKLAYRPAPMTYGKTRMMKTSRSPDKQLLQVIIDVIGCDIVVASEIMSLIRRSDRLLLRFCDGTMTNQRDRALRRALKAMTSPPHETQATLKIDGRNYRFRVADVGSHVFHREHSALNAEEAAEIKAQRNRYRHMLEKMERLDPDFIDMIEQAIDDEENQ